MLQSKTVKNKDEHCWTHNLPQHDIFLNYRVATEGRQSLHSSEPTSGIVQMMFEKLAIKKKKTGMPLFVFWDKKCLNYGQDWESGFLNGLKHSQVIVLLMSNKALEGIIAKAEKQQDNVLIDFDMSVPSYKIRSSEHLCCQFFFLKLTKINQVCNSLRFVGL
jgi:hypothetical protein